jgi:hypothetical protein
MAITGRTEIADSLSFSIKSVMAGAPRVPAFPSTAPGIQEENGVKIVE